MPPEAYRRVEILLRHIERSSGITDYQKGTGEIQSGSETATEAAIKTEQANMRFDLIIRILQETGVKPLAQMTMDLLQQFMTSPRWIRISGQPKPQMINPEDIQGQYDLIPIGSSLAGNRVLRRNQTIAIFADIVNELAVTRIAPGNIHYRICEIGVPEVIGEPVWNVRV